MPDRFCYFCIEKNNTVLAYPVPALPGRSYEPVQNTICNIFQINHFGGMVAI